MKENNKEYIGYLPICPITPRHPEMLIGIPAGYDAGDPGSESGASDFALNTETWD